VRKREPKKREAQMPDRDETADADAFGREMADVVRLRPDSRGRVHMTMPVIPATALRSTHPAAKSASDEGFNEDFAKHGIDRREIRRLKRGEYIVRDRLDLHGMSAADACTAVQRFIANSRHRRHRCVCIVHGRGLHSAAGRVSVVKTRVRDCLRTNQTVLAYVNAPSSDGGAGAVYVLLRT
jgi:DNA-nicking Smr family endonuclease